MHNRWDSNHKLRYIDQRLTPEITLLSKDYSCIQIFDNIEQNYQICRLLVKEKYTISS